MTHYVGAQLTALSIPGQGNMLGPYFAPYGAGPGYWYMSGPSFREPFRPYGRIFFGAEDPSALPQRTGLTAALAPIVAPATGGVLVRKMLDDKQNLHVEICVDQMCHSASLDLGPAISALLKKLMEEWKASSQADLPPQVVNSTVQSAVDAAQEMIVGALVDRHVNTVTSGILDTITSVIKNVTPFGLALQIKPVADIMRKFKGPIAAAAGLAAAAGATAIPGVGPFVAPVAGKLAGDLVNSSLGDPAAQKKVAQVKQEAAVDPQVAAALDAATKAVANTTAAYHVKETAQRADAGDSAAQQEIAQVATDAKAGDPAAQAVADLIANVMKSEAGAKLWEQVTGRGPGTVSSIPTTAGWYDITVGQDIAHPFLVPVVDDVGNFTGQQVMWHPTHDQIARFGGSTPLFFTAGEGGLFAFKDPKGQPYTSPRIQNFRGVPLSFYHPTWQVMYWNEGQASARTPGTSTGYMSPAQAQAVIGQWHEIIGATIDQTREQARAHATTKPGNAAGAILTPDGRVMGRGFQTLDAAIDWLQHITRNHKSFTYAAAYEKDRAGNAYIQAEEFGNATQPMALK